jgi:hypothetical protein
MIKIFYHSPVSLEKYIHIFFWGGGELGICVTFHGNSAWKVASIQPLGDIIPNVTQLLIRRFSTSFFKMICPCCALDNKNHSRFSQTQFTYSVPIQEHVLPQQSIIILIAAIPLCFAIIQ